MEKGLMDLKAFLSYKLELIRILESLGNAKSISMNSLEEFRRKLEEETFELVVVGQFKRGKTYLINALLGEELLPTGVIPVTSIITVITYGDSLSVWVFFNNGQSVNVDISEIANYVTEAGNPSNVKNVMEVHITYPSEYLKNNIKLVDTPGVGSVYRHNTDIAYKYLPKSDASIFVFSGEQPVSQAEIDFLRDVRKFAPKIFFVLNKIDLLEEREVQEALNFSTKVLEQVFGSSVRIFPVSAKLALEGHKKRAKELIEKSGLESFTRALENFLVQERGQILVTSTITKVFNLLSESALKLELEKKTITYSLKEIEAKIALVEKKSKEIQRIQSRLESTLESSVNAIIKTKLDRALEGFKNQLVKSYRGKLLDIYENNKEKPLSELSSLMERFISEKVYESFLRWYEETSDVVDRDFQEACKPLIEEVDDIHKAIINFSSDLFDMKLEGVDAYRSWTGESKKIFAIKPEPLALDFIDLVVTEKAPNWLGKKFERIRDFLFRKARSRIVRKRLDQLERYVDIYAGKIRYALVERLKKQKDSFYRDFIANLGRTMESIYEAIKKGIAIKSSEEKQIGCRLEEIERELKLIEEAKVKLTNLHGSMGFSS